MASFVLCQGKSDKFEHFLYDYSKILREHNSNRYLYTDIMDMFYIYLDLRDTLSDPQHTQKLGKITKSSKERRTTHSNVSWSSLGSWFALKYELNVSDRHHEQIQKQRRSSGWRQKGWLWFLSVGANTQTTCAKPPTNPEKALHDRRVTVVIIQRHKNQEHKVC